MRPTLIDLGGIDGFAQLEREVFGPVLHVVRWRREELRGLIERINATGYGLTHGIHTRIDETASTILSRIRAGNVYVNRNMIGAVVGVQPFGGLGLSGTGPKAGGPLYLRRLARTTTPFRFPPEMRLRLPGPTGEDNEIEFRPRGMVACVADDERALRAQARLAQSFGNTAVMVRSHLTLGIRHGLDAAHLQLVDVLDANALDAVLMDLPPERAVRLRRHVAEASRRIVPIITPDAHGNYDATRLVLERTITTNTAAAGGNARLLAMAADEA
jgi:RHH-type proline utilization regulon transcriptional repressor/proline dehydrogenase/delta 1-pyrroline-5-carboxylate dehydrogenase